ncbi:nickel-dependent hydrogenase large subunit [Thiolapillus sp.]
MKIQHAYEQAMFAGGKRTSLEEAHFSPNWEKLDLLQEKIKQLLKDRVYGVSPARWLDMESPAQLDAWMDRQQTVAACYLAKVRALGWEAVGSNETAALPVLDEARLHELMNENGFISAPTWDGRCRETSAFTRTDSALLQTLRTRHGNGLMPRLVARLTEVAQLMQWQPLAEAGTPGGGIEGTGVGQVQAARGLLTHGVMLDGEGRIERYRILAPTEWNFHPQGVVASSLAVLDGDREIVEKQARQLIHAIDPCIGYTLHVINPAPIYVTLSHHEYTRGEAPRRRQGHSLSRCGNDVHGGARGGRTD